MRLKLIVAAVFFSAVGLNAFPSAQAGNHVSVTPYSVPTAAPGHRPPRETTPSPSFQCPPPNPCHPTPIPTTTATHTPPPYPRPNTWSGVELPTMGIVFWQYGHDYNWTYQNYFTPAIMSDIKNNLRANYIRTGWIPDWFYNNEGASWQREDNVMDNACAAGLGVNVIVPPPYNDSRGEADAIANVQAFFTRYTKREPGCVIWAEVENEANIDPNTTFASYVSYYELCCFCWIRRFSLV